MKTIILLVTSLTSIILVSCQGTGFNNFSKQKFTNLKFNKSKSVDDLNHNNSAIYLINSEEELVENESTYSNNCDTIFLKNGQILVCHIIDEKQKYTEIEHCPSDGRTYQIDNANIHKINYYNSGSQPEKATAMEQEEEILTSEEETENEMESDTTDLEESIERDFEVVSDEEIKISQAKIKEQQLHAKNWSSTYNVFVISFFAAVITTIVAAMMGATFFIPIVGALFLVTYILSIVLTKDANRRTKKFDDNMVKNFELKKGFANFVTVTFSILIGVFIAVVGFFLFVF